jgi:hypothetical protein
MIYQRLTLVAVAILFFGATAQADEVVKGQVLSGGAPVARSTVYA